MGITVGRFCGEVLGRSRKTPSQLPAVTKIPNEPTRIHDDNNANMIKLDQWVRVGNVFFTSTHLLAKAASQIIIGFLCSRHT